MAPTRTLLRRHPDPAALRERAAALFDPPPVQAPPVEPESANPVPLSPPLPRDSPAGTPPPAPPPAGLRAWLCVRCGVEPRTVAALTVVLVAAVAFAAYHFWSGRPEPVTVPEAAVEAVRPVPSQGPPVPAGARRGEVVVDVTGKVRRPGVRRLPTGSRVADAVKAAGGALPGADTGALNLARLVADGEQVAVGVPVPAPGATGALVSLSAATPEQLETLPGVGPVLARHIVDYRTQHGGFTSVDQLDEVTGIGDRRLADLKPLVVP